jgi:sigma-B regulation protein RsbU (phosphoserine phosphatase)
VAVGLVVLAVNTVSIWRDVQTRHLVAEQQQAAEPALRHADALLVALLDQQEGEEAYVLTGQPAALVVYQSGLLAASALEAELRPELTGMPSAATQLDEAEALDRTWLDSVARPGIAAVGVGGAAAAQAAAGIRAGAGRATVDQIRQHLTQLSADAGARAGTISATVDDDLSTALLLAVVRSVFLLAVLAMLLLILHRLVAAPIERLTGDVETVAAGSLDHPIAATGLRDLSTLGRNTEAMRVALRNDSEEVRQLRQALAQRSPLHGLLRSELQSSEDRLDTSIAGRLLPADGVLAGDWYDAWGVGDHHVALALVDVSGHGPEAGLMALRIKHLLAPPFRMGMGPGNALAWLADQLDDLDDQCATAFVLELDPLDGRCRYANAGHPPALLFRRGGVEELGRTGPLICGLRGRSWETRAVDAGDGDLLVAVTDGLLEARLPDGDEFGIDRIRDLVGGLDPDATPDEVAEALVDAVRLACVTPLRDDATVVVVRFELGGAPAAATAGPPGVTDR